LSKDLGINYISIAYPFLTIRLSFEQEHHLYISTLIVVIPIKTQKQARRSSPSVTKHFTLANDQSLILQNLCTGHL